VGMGERSGFGGIDRGWQIDAIGLQWQNRQKFSRFALGDRRNYSTYYP
jgi:hypothetical protein